MYLFGSGETGVSVQAIYESILKEYDKDMADIDFTTKQSNRIAGGETL